MQRSMESNSPTMVSQLGTTPGRLAVALTGATGFLGRHLVQQLLDSPAVDEVHCLAVRNPTPLAQLAKTTKLIIHGGDLAKPDLEIEDAAELESIFAAAQVLFHNGADTSFLKSYATLRPTNVDSLKTLKQLTLKHRGAQRTAHIHFVSTAGVATLLGRDLGEESLGRLPPQHITEGYVLTKWVGELLVEQFGVGLGGTVGAPELDVVSSAVLGAVGSGADAEGIRRVRTVRVGGGGCTGDRRRCGRWERTWPRNWAIQRRYL